MTQPPVPVVPPTSTAPPAVVTPPVAEPPKPYAPPASQEEFNSIIESRLARERAKYPDYDTIKAKADRHDALELELGTEADKAAAKARQETAAELNSQYAPRVVTAEFRAAAKGILTAEQITEVLEDIPLTYSKYLDDKGQPDVEKIEKRVAALAPAAPAGNGTKPPRSLGQGGQPPVVVAKGEAGMAMAQKRFGIKTTP